MGKGLGEQEPPLWRGYLYLYGTKSARKNPLHLHLALSYVLILPS